MTTIAYKDGVVAFDSLVVNGNTIIGYDNAKAKRYIFKDRTFIMAAAGSVFSCDKLEKWAETNLDPEHRPDTDDSGSLQAFMITDEEELFLIDTSFIPWKIETEFFSVGNGDDLAFGAMANGASALEAVKVAAKYNVNTGGKIRQLKIKFKEKD